MTGKPTQKSKGSILIVDDEPNILQGIRRQLHKRFDLVLAEGGDQALALVHDQGPFAVVICDMNMPGMSGLEVLAKIGEHDPDTVRIMLTGQADLNTAVDAINHGNIFRFFVKPCAAEILAAGLEAGLEQYRLITSERELLNKTLSGSIKVLTDILAMADPDSFGRAERTRQWCQVIAEELGLQRHVWKLEMATMLAPIGLTALPPETAKKARSHQPLSAVEQEMVDATAETAHDLICNIPRLNEVATYVLYQNKNVDGTGFPRDDKAGASIPVGARIVKILNDLVLAQDNGAELRDALALMRKHDKVYDAKLVDVIAPVLLRDEPDGSGSLVEKVEVQLAALRPGDVLQAPIIDLEREDLILAKGSAITELYIKRLNNLGRVRKLTPTVFVQRTKENTLAAAG